MKEGTLVGAVKIDKDFRDIRGRVIKAGTFTVRYGIQPPMAIISAYRRTASSCCSPRPRIDTDPAPRGHDAPGRSLQGGDRRLASGGAEHRSPGRRPPRRSRCTTTELGHKAIILEIPAAGTASLCALASC